MMTGMGYEPTSSDVDRMLEARPDALGERLEASPDLRVHIEVAMDGATLRLLEERADREHRPLADVVRDAVRAGLAAA